MQPRLLSGLAETLQPSGSGGLHLGAERSALVQVACMETAGLHATWLWRRREERVCAGGMSCVVKPAQFPHTRQHLGFPTQPTYPVHALAGSARARVQHRDTERRNDTSVIGAERERIIRNMTPRLGHQPLVNVPRGLPRTEHHLTQKPTNERRRGNDREQRWKPHGAHTARCLHMWSGSSIGIFGH